MYWSGSSAIRPMSGVCEGLAALMPRSPIAEYASVYRCGSVIWRCGHQPVFGATRRWSCFCPSHAVVRKPRAFRPCHLQSVSRTVDIRIAMLPCESIPTDGSRTDIQESDRPFRMLRQRVLALLLHEQPFGKLFRHRDEIEYLFRVGELAVPGDWEDGFGALDGDADDGRRCSSSLLSNSWSSSDYRRVASQGCLKDGELHRWSLLVAGFCSGRVNLHWRDADQFFELLWCRKLAYESIDPRLTV